MHMATSGRTCVSLIAVPCIQLLSQIYGTTV
jgi:hypothetical protein